MRGSAKHERRNKVPSYSKKQKRSSPGQTKKALPAYKRETCCQNAHKDEQMKKKSEPMLKKRMRQEAGGVTYPKQMLPEQAAVQEHDIENIWRSMTKALSTCSTT